MNNPWTAEELALKIAATSTKIALHDEVWRGFGYPRRPKRGAIFNKLIRLIDEQKIDREEFLVRDITAICVATLAKGLGGRGVAPAELAARVIELVMDYDGVAGAYGFDSPSEGARHLATAVGEYIKAGRDGKPATLVSRAASRFGDMPEAEWLAGGIRLCTMGPAEAAVTSIGSTIEFPVTGSVDLRQTSLASVIENAESAEAISIDE